MQLCCEKFRNCAISKRDRLILFMKQKNTLAIETLYYIHNIESILLLITSQYYKTCYYCDDNTYDPIQREKNPANDVRRVDVTREALFYLDIIVKRNTWIRRRR